MEPQETRGSCKFFASYLAAAKMLPSKEDQADFLMAICDYGITGVEPETTGAAAALFMLAKPNIDASNKKSGIKVSKATYRKILAVRRFVK